MTPTTRMGLDLERILGDYLGTDSFPSNEWPEVCQAFAHAVEAVGYASEGPEAAKGSMAAVARLVSALAAVTE